ncbi:2-methylcitrate dehydratase [Aneurinibacillus sp. REN35]|uniref:2-methylcitrate dehydratase n=1 Tax=Aneurinibacillus sp. REN35 TaxID=3237286 RepID=UPI00352801B0
MPYMELKGLIKKVNLKPNGEKEILLVVSENEMRGKLDSVSEMIGCRVDVSLESLIVNYTVEINANTEEPMRTYRVDEKGIVHEIKPEGEQLEANLGLPEAKIPTKEEKEQTEREIIDDFILSGLAPSYEDLPYDFANIVKRRLEGETYMKLASELDISSGKIVELIDEYRKRLAPLAAKWDEWRQEKEQSKQETTADPGEVATGTGEPDQSEQDEEDTDSLKGQATENLGSDGQEPSEEEIEEYILGGHAPKFPDIEFDFPQLLDKKRKRGSWTKVASEMNLPLVQVRRQWREYKERIARQMRGEDIA